MRLPRNRMNPTENGPVRVCVARNGGKAGHERKASENRDGLFSDMDLAEVMQEYSNTESKSRRNSAKSSRRRKQLSNSSATAQASTRGREDSQHSDLNEFFSPVSSEEADSIEATTSADQTMSSNGLGEQEFFVTTVPQHQHDHDCECEPSPKRSLWSRIRRKPISS